MWDGHRMGHLGDGTWGGDTWRDTRQTWPGVLAWTGAGPAVPPPSASRAPAGGAPDPRALTGGKFSSGISGCVRGLALESAGIPRHPIDLRHGALGGSPVPPCPS